MRKILVTGSTGQIGSELTPELRKIYGKENVIATIHKRRLGQEVEEGPTEYLDVSRMEQVRKIVQQYDIGTVYHLAAILSAKAEKDHLLAWEVNVGGLINILEASKEYSIERIFWPSSIAVFGPDVPRINTPQDAPLNPTTIYGITKVVGELLCNYYFLKFGLDIRCIRYPGLISNVALPGGGTTDYAVEIFYEAITKKRYTCFLREDTRLPMMYMPDAIRAALMIMNAPKENIRIRKGYNLTAMSFTPKELVDEIKKHIKGFECIYEPDERQKIADSWPMSIDDTHARMDWGWRPIYDMAAMTKDMIDKLSLKLYNGNR